LVASSLCLAIGMDPASADWQPEKARLIAKRLCYSKLDEPTFNRQVQANNIATWAYTMQHTTWHLAT
jgi:hypothetical protein